MSALAALIVPWVAAWTQAGAAPHATPLITRVQVGTMSASGYTDPSFTLGATLGYQVDAHWAVVLDAFHQRAHVLPPYDSLGVLDRVAVAAAVEWSRQPLEPHDLAGDVIGSFRLAGGILFREDLSAAGLVGLGALVRLGLTSRFAAIAAVHGLLIIAPDDPLPRCTRPGGVVGGLPVCHPFAVDGSAQLTGTISAGVELRL